MAACVTYESVLAVYVMLFFVWQIVRLKDSSKWKDIAVQCIMFSSPLFLGVGLRIGVTKLIGLFLPANEVAAIVADNQMFSGYKSADALINLIESCLVKYGIMGIWYFPITVFVISVIVIMGLLCIDLYCVKKIWRVLFAYGGFLFSLLMLPLMKGDYAPYRTCFYFGVFVGVSFALLYLKICNCSRHKWMYSFYCCITVGILLCQVNEINYWFDLNYRRWEQEQETIREVGSYLAVNDEQKPVVFVGSYRLSEEMYVQLRVSENDYIFDTMNNKYEALTGRQLLKSRKKVETSVESVIDWGIDAFGEPNTELIKLFRYCGYKVRQGTEEMYREALAYKNEMPSWPQEGCMKDMGDYYIFKW